MEGDRFDRLTKRFAPRRTSRRRVVTGLSGGLAGAALAALGVGSEAGAFVCRQPGVLCAKDAQCCSGSCVDYHCACPDGGPLCGHDCCTSPATCGGGGTPGVCGCTPESMSTTCAGKCGPQTNNCGQRVDCGTCCTPTTTCPQDQCGQTIDDGCGGTLACPACCAAGSCPPGGTLCSSFGPGCSTNPDCGCYQNVEGQTVCIDFAQDCNSFSPCTSSADCPAGQSCLDVECACGANPARMCFPCCAG